MPTLHVCSLASLSDTVTATGARSLVTLINVGTTVERPASIAQERHLRVDFSDIVEPVDGHIMPDEAHVRSLLDFVARWDRAEPLLIHCFAGISRSTAGAYIAACALAPERSEAAIAEALRRASPSATPNRRLVAIADRMLGREGRMIDAVERIGRGADAFSGEPFCLTLE